MATDTPASDDLDEGRRARNGVIIVVAAVVVGLLLLTKGYGSGSPEISERTDGGASAAIVVETTTTTLLTNPPASVKVKVVNAANIQNLATKTRERLQVAGYTEVLVGDASQVQDRTTIYYQPGAQGDAQAVAAVLGFNADQVLQMTAPPPAELAGATVLVMAGTDLK
ncbi:MAG: LytR C-terminal domain-containing protein [Acidimicrobiales bacterium]